MKITAVVLGTVTLAALLVAGGLWAGTAWAQGSGPYRAAGYGHMGSGMMQWDGASGLSASDGGLGCGAQGYGAMDPGVTGSGWLGCGATGPGVIGSDWPDMPCDEAYIAPADGGIDSLEEAEAAVEGYVERLGYPGLEITEVMEFERNFYAIVAEESTGIGAMELLVDKSSGTVGPEPGPNMMSNAEYGMMGGRGMRGMMGGFATGETTLSTQAAQDVAQGWLDANLPGRTAGEADPFYGYYTLHFQQDGEIEGMLSVHGSSGAVWYHSWHGDFIGMTEGHS